MEVELLNADLFVDVLNVAVNRLATDSGQATGWLSERERLDRELANLAAAIAGGADLPSLIAEMLKRETRKRELTLLLQRPGLDAVSLRSDLAAKLAGWKRLLRERPVHGHRVLKTLLDGPIRLGAKPSPV